MHSQNFPSLRKTSFKSMQKSCSEPGKRDLLELSPSPRSCPPAHQGTRPQQAPPSRRAGQQSRPAHVLEGVFRILWYQNQDGTALRLRVPQVPTPNKSRLADEAAVCQVSPPPPQQQMASRSYSLPNLDKAQIRWKEWLTGRVLDTLIVAGRLQHIFDFLPTG